MEPAQPQSDTKQAPSPQSPKPDCPHQSTLNPKKIISHIKPYLLKKSCEDCDVTESILMCLKCLQIGCSKDSNSHIVKHTERKGHKIVLSFADSLFWCYSCDSYVISKELEAIAKHFNYVKSPETQEKPDKEISELTEAFKELSTKDTAKDKKKKKGKKTEFTREDLVEGLKEKSFKKIIILTGAGISVSAGIPDFRSPKTGLYANLQKYNLPFPEAVFDLKYFRKNPQPFYLLSKELFGQKVNPVITHHFIKLLADEGLLHLNFTQNIDGLEVDAGVDPKHMVEAHGHNRSARCIVCQKEADMKEYMKHVGDQKIYKCECSGLIKPDIVFFGEDLPMRFFENVNEMREADLVIVMGTSLMVMPFASLVGMVPKDVPLVYINRENTQIKRDNFLFMKGDIDGQVKDLIKDIGWENKFDNIVKDLKAKL